MADSVVKSAGFSCVSGENEEKSDSSESSTDSTDSSTAPTSPTAPTVTTDVQATKEQYAAVFGPQLPPGQLDKL